MNLFSHLKQECRAIFSDSAVLLTVFGGVLLYSFLYPLPYLRQTPRDLPLIVVNLDNSQASRRLEYLVDASPSVRLALRAGSMDEAQQRLVSEKMAGILVIPENFHNDLLRGRRPTLTMAGDADFFLVYGKVVEGMNGAAKALIAEIAGPGQPWRKTAHAPGIASPAEPIRLDLAPLFNSGMGYLTYVIPAVYILILHQTLIIGIGLTTAGRREQPLPLAGEPFWKSALHTLLARSALFVAIYWFLAMYYFGVSFDLYHIPRLGDLSELQFLFAPLFLGASCLGICVGLAVPRRELVILVVLVSSMPLIFLSGFIWPSTAIPALLNGLAQAVPVIPAITAYLTLNHLGADFQDILAPLTTLWLQAVFYGALASYLLWREQQTKKPPADH